MFLSKKYTKIILTLMLASALFSPKLIFSQDQNLESKCLSLTQNGCGQTDDASCRKALEECEKYYSSESDRIANDMNKTQNEKKTLQNKIYALNQKIKQLNYNISQSNLIIKDLKIQITDTEGSIGSNTLKIEELKNQLSGVLRTLYEQDRKTLLEIMLEESDLSNFFNSVVGLEIIGEKNRDLLQDIKILKASLEGQKISLDSEKGDLEATVKMHELQKQENSSVKQDQEYYLKLTEQEYQKQAQEKKATDEMIAKIRTRIFELAGGGTKAPTFGEAYEMAKYVESITGVRPALLLAVLQQESAIGKNVGQCYLKNTNTGAGIKITTGASIANVMKPSRDVSPFLKITADSGRDPYSTPVSCPMSFGYGGAMGPAQFIPSTWISYADRLKSILGRAADPWNIKDSFLAAGLYLSDYGAKSQTRSGEWKAAMIYFSGSTNSKYSFYGDQVLSKADAFQKDINLLTGVQ